MKKFIALAFLLFASTSVSYANELSVVPDIEISLCRCDPSVTGPARKIMEEHGIPSSDVTFDSSNCGGVPACGGFCTVSYQGTPIFLAQCKLYRQTIVTTSHDVSSGH